MWRLHQLTSNNHHYYGSISAWFFESLAGIRPTKPGYERLQIKPYIPTDLSKASGTLDTVKGRVVSHWTREDGVLLLDVTIPGNTPADVWVPSTNGPAAEAPPGAVFQRAEEEYAVYTIGAGTHRFRSVY